MNMASPEETLLIIRQVLNEERKGSNERIAATVKAVFDIMGVNVEDHQEVRDLRSGIQRLKRWDKSVGQIERAGRVALVTAFVTGGLGLLWLGLLDTIASPVKKLFH
jgi:hypothetical protein